MIDLNQMLFEEQSRELPQHTRRKSKRRPVTHQAVRILDLFAGAGGEERRKRIEERGDARGRPVETLGQHYLGSGRSLKSVMSNEAKIGTIPTGNEGRDAVHVAIVPIRAATFLRCGTPVKLNCDGEAFECAVNDAVGVVDPFMPQNRSFVPKGQWFWLCLYPKTITGLRHVWSHPSFPSVEVVAARTAAGDKSASQTWLKEYVRKHCPYWKDQSDGGYAEFLSYVKYERFIYYAGSDCHGLEDVEDAEELFRHLSIVLDLAIGSSYFKAFTCSC